jgi:hypothetical protein
MESTILFYFILFYLKKFFKFLNMESIWKLLSEKISERGKHFSPIHNNKNYNLFLM